eukprot:TRINITY_DN4482_c0_g1_i1.p1 TRINITY_DN4482_c0_g1~~TRINITY_DN4482_c0_g1_i1.p1  ORF type:complete len:859 (+),score=164.71 TRINITY_DN4482_c0_g1_i1:47-2578(+)
MTPDVVADTSKKRRTGGRIRTRNAKREHNLRELLDRVGEDDINQQVAKINRMKIDLQRAEELLSRMQHAYNKRLEEEEQKRIEEAQRLAAMPVLPPVIPFYSDWAATDTEDESICQAAINEHTTMPNSDDDFSENIRPLEPQDPLGPITIGLVGHVAHGKSSLIKMLTGKSTMQFRAERLANATMKLGYADAVLYRSLHSTRGHRRYYMTSGSQPVVDPVHPDTGEKCEFVRKVSFLDCPGHEKYAETMLCGAIVMDAAIVVAAANEEFPQPQTAEHLDILREYGIPSENIIVAHNKVDLVGAQAVNQLATIRKYVGQNAAIIPCSAVQSANRECIVSALAAIACPERDMSLNTPPVVRIIRSFNINRRTGQGRQKDELLGGVLGGSVVTGQLRVGQKITLYPAMLTATVKSLIADGTPTNTAIPGELIGIGTDLHPDLAQADRLVGQVIGTLDSTVEMSHTDIHLTSVERRVTDGRKSSKLKNNEAVRLTVGAMHVPGTVISSKATAGTAHIKIDNPICTTYNQRVIISRKDSHGFRIVAAGIVRTESHQKDLQKLYDGELSSDPTLEQFYASLKKKSKSVEARERGRRIKRTAVAAAAAEVAKSFAMNKVDNDEEATSVEEDPIIEKAETAQPVVWSDDSGTSVRKLKKKTKKKKRKKVHTDPATERTEEEQELDRNIGISDAHYARMLYSALGSVKIQEKTSMKFKVPAPAIIKLTRHCVGVSNFPQIINILNRPAEHVKNFIANELGIKASIDQQGCLLLSRLSKTSSVQVALRKYVWMFVVCKMCNSGTAVHKTDGMTELFCLKCHATRNVNFNQVSLFTAASKTERRAARQKAVTEA